LVGATMMGIPVMTTLTITGAIRAGVGQHRDGTVFSLPVV